MEKIQECPGYDMSIVANIGFLHHPRIFRELCARRTSKLLGRRAAHGQSLGSQALANIGIGESLEDFCVEARDDGLRRAGRRHQGKP